MELVVAVYAQTRRFPKEETYGLTSQMRRSAVSIPSNIAEGKGRSTDREFWEVRSASSDISRKGNLRSEV
jgi:four helix bundle protein